MLQIHLEITKTKYNSNYLLDSHQVFLTYADDNYSKNINGSWQILQEYAVKMV